MKIPWDLEETPLQIKTDSTLGSDDKIWVRMYDKDDSWISGVRVRFLTTMMYMIEYCTPGDGTNYVNLPVQPVVEAETIWTITKTETSLNISCNNVEVLNYFFADSSSSNCVPKLGGDVVEAIKFHSSDKASDFYRAGKDLSL